MKIETLSDIIGSPVAQSTFYDWLRVCKIPTMRKEPYSKTQVNTLEALAIHLRRGHSYKTFDPTIAY